MIFTINLKLGPGMNLREHHFARARRVKNEKSVVGWSLRKQQAPAGPVRVILTRCMAGKGLDGDNLQGSLKAPRDAVAGWLGRDDADKSIDWVYAQAPAPLGKGFMTVEIQPIAEGGAL
ncbi:MAG: hypothetical protein GAK28_04761 [Luteibacter sp.]|uniref:hypothetical protein n=1 Tax=Luteibacter sp. TaxID=1886636 RepID=UPI00137F77DE|nr:hypothetical protein [Luteibacter sp.]KAF1003322.1 MAG: hypothetical protein GAK28_04761 [Luteibacter sp.]